MLKNIFKSKLAHPDEEIRLKAISKLDSASKLINIIKEDKHLECKMAALEKLEAVYDLITIYDYIKSCKTRPLEDLLIKKFENMIEQTNSRSELTDIKSSIRWATVSYGARDKLVELTKSIINQNELFQIVISESLYWVYIEAINAINDINLLLRIVFETKDSGIQSKREIAIEKLIKIIIDTKDQDKLTYYLENISLPKVRAAAILNIKNQIIIEEHAQCDKDYLVRINAIKNLKDKNVALKLLDDNDNGIKAEALKLIYDQSILVEYALNSKYKKIRIAAIQNIIDESFLTNVILKDKDYEIRCAAVKNISNQEVLEKLAMGDDDWLVRLYAIKKVESQDVLEKYLMNDGENFHSAECVVERIFNQQVLFNVVKTHDRKEIRFLALKNISDDNILGEIAKKHCEKGSYMGYGVKIKKHHYSSNKFIHTVICKITNPLTLKDIVLNGKNRACKQEAAHKIYDQQILADIYVTCEDESLRNIVSYNFNGQTAYNYIAINANSPKDRCYAIEKIDSQRILFNIIRNEKVKSVRKMAVEKLSDSESLSFIVKNDKDWSICVSALNNITDQEILTDFALDNLSSIIRTIAVKKLKEKAILNRIAEFDKDISVREIAKEMIKNL